MRAVPPAELVCVMIAAMVGSAGFLPTVGAAPLPSPVNSTTTENPLLLTTNPGTTNGLQNPEPGFFSAIAYGAVHPEVCTRTPYNPNIRFITAMSMLLFPIVFYACYECCFSGSEVCAGCCTKYRRSKSVRVGSDDLLTGSRCAIVDNPEQQPEAERQSETKAPA